MYGGQTASATMSVDFCVKYCESKGLPWAGLYMARRIGAQDI